MHFRITKLRQQVKPFAAGASRRRFSRPSLSRLKWLIAGVLAVGAAVSAGASAAPAPICFGKHATIVGSGLINGTSGDDVIVGSAGADLVNAGDGNDRVCGLAGTDDLRGELGDDRLDGGPGDDR